MKVILFYSVLLLIATTISCQYVDVEKCSPNSETMFASKLAGYKLFLLNITAKYQPGDVELVYHGYRPAALTALERNKGVASKNLTYTADILYRLVDECQKLTASPLVFFNSAFVFNKCKYLFKNIFLNLVSTSPHQHTGKR